MDSKESLFLCLLIRSVCAMPMDDSTATVCVPYIFPHICHKESITMWTHVLVDIVVSGGHPHPRGLPDSRISRTLARPTHAQSVTDIARSTLRLRPHTHTVTHGHILYLTHNLACPRHARARSRPALTARPLQECLSVPHSTRTSDLQRRGAAPAHPPLRPVESN